MYKYVNFREYKKKAWQSQALSQKREKKLVFTQNTIKHDNS